MRFGCLIIGINVNIFYATRIKCFFSYRDTPFSTFFWFHSMLTIYIALNDGWKQVRIQDALLITANGSSAGECKKSADC